MQGKTPGCPKREVCKKDCFECDFGHEFRKMWEIIFSYKKKVKEQQKEIFKLKHPEAALIISKNWELFNRCDQGEQLDILKGEK